LIKLIWHVVGAYGIVLKCKHKVTVIYAKYVVFIVQTCTEVLFYYCHYLSVLLYQVAQKSSRTFACIIHSSSQSKSVQKHICNDQTSSNLCRNFRLKHFCISRDTNKIVSHHKAIFASGLLLLLDTFSTAV